MKNVLIITNYYPPETGAASNRIQQLAKGLYERGFSVEVLTPLPNYPTGKVFNDYKRTFKHSTTEDGITVNRLWIYANNSKNKLLRLLAMLSYGFSLIWYFLWHKGSKTIIIQSPPLIVAFVSILFLRSKKRKLILNVSDLWPSAGLELGVFKYNFSYKLLQKIERYNYKNANLILGQSEEILSHIKSLFPKKETLLYRNYPNFKVPVLENTNLTNGNDKIKLVYAGLLGVAQGILKLIKNMDYSNIEFHIYGDGQEREQIVLYLKNNPNLPVFYHGEISREQLHKTLLKYNLTIIPLLNRIYGSVPSKLFEYARLGLPAIYFGGGEGELIVEKYNLGWVVKAKDYSALNRLLKSIKRKDFDNSKRIGIQNTALKTFSINDQLDLLSNILVNN